MKAESIPLYSVSNREAENSDVCYLTGVCARATVMSAISELLASCIDARNKKPRSGRRMACTRALAARRVKFLQSRHQNKRHEN